MSREGQKFHADASQIQHHAVGKVLEDLLGNGGKVLRRQGQAVMFGEEIRPEGLRLVGGKDRFL